MSGLNAIALIWFGSIHRIAGWICDVPTGTRKLILRILGLILLTGNGLVYALPPLLGQGLRLPVEFSAIAYFIVPLFILAGRGKTGSWAAYSGLMAGFFYFLAMILRGEILYGADTPSLIYLSMLNHGILYLFGLTAIRVRLYPTSDRGVLMAGILCVASWALVIRPWVEEPGALLIYKLLDASLVRAALPQVSRTVALPGYYLGLALLIGISFRVFFLINRRQYQVSPIRILRAKNSC